MDCSRSVVSLEELARELIWRNGTTLPGLKFLLCQLNVMDKLFPATIDDATVQNLRQDFLIFNRQGLNAFQDLSKKLSLSHDFSTPLLVVSHWYYATAQPQASEGKWEIDTENGCHFRQLAIGDDSLANLRTGTLFRIHNRP